MLQFLLRYFQPASDTAADSPWPDTQPTTTIVFLVMRRMRVPLLVLVAVYVISLLGFILIPGDQGKPPLSIFHAFYVVSYTATTIGFGELPETFSNGQRMWMTLSIYLSVIGWLYAVGAMLALIQDEALKRAITEHRFSRTVRGIREPFYLVCGYGDTGEALVSALEERFMRAVVIEMRQKRIDALIMENYPVYVPRLCADAGKPEYLLEGGLKSAYCKGVVAITNDNTVNLHVAITAKLLHPGIKTICRVDSEEVAANMASFGTDRIINPFNLFAARMHTALHSPGLYLLREWLSGRHDTQLSDPIHPPAKGLWILCGYGRFGKAVQKRLREERAIEIVVVEATLDKTGYPAEKFVAGWGTEAHTLREAGIEQAAGLVIGTDNDVNNLSILMTARQLNPDLFIVLRQNLTANDVVFKAAHADLVMKPSLIIADYIRVALTTPLLVDFMALAKKRGNTWACELISRLSGLLADRVPAVWEITLDQAQAPALVEYFNQGQAVSVGCLSRDPRNRESRLACLPLLLVRGQHKILAPADDELLHSGDQLLCCGHSESAWWMGWTLRDPSALAYVAEDRVPPRGLFWRWLQARRAP